MHDPLWQTRDGRLLRISEMEERHIVNCINKIRRSKRGWRREYLERLELELEIRKLIGRKVA